MIESRIATLILAIAVLVSVASAQTPFFTQGDLVVAVSGCGIYGGGSGGTCNPTGGTGATTGTGSGTYGDDQAAPWSLFEFSCPGGCTTPTSLGVTYVNSLALPTVTSGANIPISNDYGSQSEGTIQLSGDGVYLTMLGIGINAADFNVNPSLYCENYTAVGLCDPENGNPAAAQSVSLTGYSVTAVPRVAALIDANGNVNTSTVLYNIFDQNDPRSAYLPSSTGTNIYVSGQGCKVCTNTGVTPLATGGWYDNGSGVFLTTVGTTNNSPTAITGPDNGPTGCSTPSTCDSSTSTRQVAIANPTGTGTVNTQNGSVGTSGEPGYCASDCAIWESGAQFVPGITGITINSVNYTISSVVTSTLLQLSSAPGTQNGSSFSYATPSTLYVSEDDHPGGSKGGNGGAGYNRAYLGTLGTPAPTSLFTCAGVGAGCPSGDGPYGPSLLTGLGNTGGTGKVTIRSGTTTNGNALNNTPGNSLINLSPQNFYFASPTVLYVTDTGSPKNTSNGPDAVCTADGGADTVGDGGLQKWVYSLRQIYPTISTKTLTAPTGTFSSADVGLPVSGTGIASASTGVTGITVTSGSTTVTGPTGTFSANQVGNAISDLLGYIPVGTTITARASGGASVTISAAATNSSSSDTINIGGATIASVTNSTTAVMSSPLGSSGASPEAVTIGAGWNLVYTLSNGLDLTTNADCDPSSPQSPGATNASTGLFGLAGVVNSGVATLYVTGYPNNDLVQSYLWGIQDTLSTTTMTSPGTDFTLLATAPAGSLFRGVSFTPTIPNSSVEITTAPPGLTVTTSGTGCDPSTITAPLTEAWTPGNSCTLSVTSPQTVGGAQYTFAQWQDGTTGTSDVVVAPSTTATYTATFNTQYQLTTSVAGGGASSTISPSGYYTSGTGATVTATAGSGYCFLNFTGSTTLEGYPPSSIASVTNPLSVLMNEPQSVTANFAQGTGLYSPASGSTLPGASAGFNWCTVPTATAYWLDVGPTEGSNTYAQSGSLSTSTLSYTVNSLPTNGSTVWARWYYLINGSWQYTDYYYTAFGGSGQIAVMTSPTPGSMLSGSSVTFQWSAGTAATAYWIDIGSTAGGHDVYQSGSLGNVLMTTVNGLPTNGETLYVTLYSLTSQGWLSNAYTYTAYNPGAGGSPAVITNPSPGATLTGSSQTFNWTTGTGATAYWLDVGSTPNGQQYQTGNLGTAQMVTVNGLPEDGSTIYATLYSLIGGVWESNSYTYTAYNLSGAGLAVMQTPTPGSTLSGYQVTFTWSAGSGATAYWVDVSAIGPGGNDLDQSGNLGTAQSYTIYNLPATNPASEIWVTLYSLVGGVWESNGYIYYSGP